MKVLNFKNINLDIRINFPKNEIWDLVFEIFSKMKGSLQRPTLQFITVQRIVENFDDKETLELYELLKQRVDEIKTAKIKEQLYKKIEKYECLHEYLPTVEKIEKCCITQIHVRINIAPHLYIKTNGKTTDTLEKFEDDGLVFYGETSNKELIEFADLITGKLEFKTEVDYEYDEDLVTEIEQEFDRSIIKKIKKYLSGKTNELVL